MTETQKREVLMLVLGPVILWLLVPSLLLLLRERNHDVNRVEKEEEPNEGCYCLLVYR